jgi:FkbM family methyltransferase
MDADQTLAPSTPAPRTLLRNVKSLIKRYVPFAPAVSQAFRSMLRKKTDDQLVEELWTKLLARLCMANSDVFFVEVGANDGVSFDPIHAHVVRHRWRGLLVEPLPDFFRQLTETYRSCVGLILENVAIADHPGYRDMYRVSPNGLSNGTLPTWAKGIASFFNDRNALGGCRISPAVFEKIRPYVTIQQVPCDTLNNVLSRHNITKIDVFQVDVEGYDYHVLKQLDLSRFQPSIVRIEWFNLPDDEKRLALDLLRSHGYQIRLSKTDLIAWRNLGTIAHFIYAARHRFLAASRAGQ